MDVAPCPRAPRFPGRRAFWDGYPGRRQTASAGQSRGGPVCFPKRPSLPFAHQAVTANAIMSVRLNVFVSSGMAELEAERRAVETALRTLEVEAWRFEEDAGAQTTAAREVYLTEIANTDLNLVHVDINVITYHVLGMEHPNVFNVACWRSRCRDRAHTRSDYPGENAKPCRHDAVNIRYRIVMWCAPGSCSWPLKGWRTR